MSDQPKPTTGEWTAFGASVKRVGDDDSLFNCSTRTDADVAVRTHNAALDAERETISPEMQPNGGIDRKDKALQEQAQIIAGLHQQLAAGQESRESAEANCDLLATEKHRIHGEVQQLRSQLAEEKENCKNAHDAYNLVSDKNRELHRKLAAELVWLRAQCGGHESADIDQIISAAQQPLVELLMELRNRINRGQFRNHLEIDKDEVETIQQIDAALARVKER